MTAETQARCTCTLGYNYAANCPNCQAKATLHRIESELGHTDLLRAGAAGMAEGMRLRGGSHRISCSCGTAQVVTEYDFDEKGRLAEPVLWGIVAAMECALGNETHSLSAAAI